MVYFWKNVFMLENLNKLLSWSGSLSIEPLCLYNFVSFVNFVNFDQAVLKSPVVHFTVLHYSHPSPLCNVLSTNFSPFFPFLHQAYQFLSLLTCSHPCCPYTWGSCSFIANWTFHSERNNYSPERKRGLPWNADMTRNVTLPFTSLQHNQTQEWHRRGQGAGGVMERPGNRTWVKEGRIKAWPDRRDVKNK